MQLAGHDYTERGLHEIEAMMKTFPAESEIYQLMSKAADGIREYQQRIESYLKWLMSGGLEGEPYDFDEDDDLE